MHLPHFFCPTLLASEIHCSKYTLSCILLWTCVKSSLGYIYLGVEFLGHRKGALIYMLTRTTGGCLPTSLSVLGFIQLSSICQSDGYKVGVSLLQFTFSDY